MKCPICGEERPCQVAGITVFGEHRTANAMRDTAQTFKLVMCLMCTTKFFEEIIVIGQRYEDKARAAEAEAAVEKPK